MTELATTAPITKTVTVGCDVHTAFRVFTDEIGTWWPTETHSVHKHDVGELVFEGREGGDLYEVTRSGEKAHWARVTAWDVHMRASQHTRGPSVTACAEVLPGRLTGLAAA